MRDAFVRALLEAMKEDKSIELVTGDLGFGVLNPIKEVFPDRITNAGISEQNMMSLSAGMALEGKNVVVYSIGNFPTLRCLEQIRNDCAYHNANVKIVCVGGGFVYGALGMSHQATEDIASLRAIPNVTVLTPCDKYESYSLTKTMLKEKGVFYLRLGRGGEELAHDGEINCEIGKAIKIKDGTNYTVFSSGGCFTEAKKAVEKMESLGLSTSLYTFPTVKPIDREVILECAKTSRVIVTVEEHNIVGGFGSAVAEVLAEDEIHLARLIRVGLNDTFASKVGNQEYLRKEYGIDSDSIVKKVLDAIGESEETLPKTHIFLSSPHMGGEELKYIYEAFDTNWVAPLGKNVNEFEKEMASYVGGGYCAALYGGTGAIHMALKAAGVKKDDIVFCSTLTFAATANPIKYEHAIPVFIDSDRETWNMSSKALEKAFEKYSPKAVVVANLYGQSADMDSIVEISHKHGAVVIEDAAESLGAEYKGRKSGTIGDYGIFSFNGNKIITTSGGGMLFSKDEEKIKKVRFWSTQAREQARHYEHKELGYNYRMSNIVAGIGRGQIFVLDKRVAKKGEIYNLYKEEFKDIPYIEMMPEYETSNHWLSCITLKEGSPVTPLDIMVALENNDIESRPIWKPMHMQPYYSDCDYFTAGDEDVSRSIFESGVCLPSDSKMTKEEQQRVISTIKTLFR